MPIHCMMLADLCNAIIEDGKEIEHENETFDGVRVEKRFFVLNGSPWIITTTNGCITQLTTSAIRDILKK